MSFALPAQRSAIEDRGHYREIGKLLGQPFDALESQFVDFLAYYDFTRQDWTILSSSGLDETDLLEQDRFEFLPDYLQLKILSCSDRINELVPSIFPRGISSWDQPFQMSDHADSPLAGWPWPYRQSEVNQVALLLPAETQGLMAKVVWAARKFLRAKANNKKFGLKPNPPKELARLREAARGFMEAVDHTSDIARQLAGLDDLDLMRVKLTVDRLQHALPRINSSSGGRSKEIEEQELIWDLQQVFQTVYSISSSPCKWEDFIIACTDPLVSFRLRDGSCAMSKVGPSAWRSRLTAALKRHNAMKNHP